jgi:hypothetical protein
MSTAAGVSATTDMPTTYVPTTYVPTATMKAAAGWVSAATSVKATASARMTAAMKATVAMESAAVASVISAASIADEAMTAPTMAVAPVRPRSNAEENSVVEVARSVIPVWCAGVGGIAVIAILAGRRPATHADTNGDLSFCLGCHRKRDKYGCAR